jgi:hypothetical protein
MRKNEQTRKGRLEDSALHLAIPAVGLPFLSTLAGKLDGKQNVDPGAIVYAPHLVEREKIAVAGSGNTLGVTVDDAINMGIVGSVLTVLHDDGEWLRFQFASGYQLECRVGRNSLVVVYP